MSRRFSLPEPSMPVIAPGPTPSGLTSSRVPYTFNGRLTDDGGLRYVDTIGLLLEDGISVSSGDFFALGGKIIVYNAFDTEGTGIPYILDDVALTGQVANIASTNFTNAGTAGTYRVGYYLVCTTSAVGAGTIVFAVTFSDGIAVRTLTGTGVLMTSTNKASTFTNADINGSLIKLGSGSIAYSVTVTGIYSTAVYALFCTLERLS